MCQLYLKHIPAEVRPDTTEPVAGALSAEAHALSHQQKFEADGYAPARQLGVGLDYAGAAARWQRGWKSRAPSKKPLLLSDTRGLK